MNIQLIGLSALKQYDHPSAKLFRSLELRATYFLVKNVLFKQPSLDLGSGDGYISSLLFDDQFSYGLDNNEAGDVQISIEKKRYGKVLLESAEKMSLPSNSLRFVFSNSVIEHIPPQETVLKEVHRVLKPGGHLLFTTPSSYFKEYLYVSKIFRSVGLGPLASWYAQERNKRLNHYHLYSKEEWQKRLQKLGFTVQKIAYCIPKESLLLWDKMALEVLAGKVFTKQAELSVLSKYALDITRELHKEVFCEKGADLVVLAVKEKKS